MALEPISTDLTWVRDGRYTGGTGPYRVDLRVDLTTDKRISGDVWNADPVRSASGGPFASFRTADNWQPDAIGIELTSDAGVTGEGRLEVNRSMGSKADVAVTICMDGCFGELPAGTTVGVELVWTGPELREVGLEMETEDGVEWPGEEPAAKMDSAAVITVQECLRRAGFATRPIGSATAIPAKPGGWQESDIFAQLTEVMKNAAQAPLDETGFGIHLLRLSRTDRGRLMGIMFDLDSQARQGAAVFVDTIRGLGPEEQTDRKIIQTAVHEIGHAFNLVHRFDPDVRRSTSTSFMNYDWRYRGGDLTEEDSGPAQQAAAYWGVFDDTFDSDELQFLRHGPWPQIVPGGAPFGSATYWATSTAGDVPTGRNAPWSHLRLWFTPPAAGTTVDFGQPIFVEVSLSNSGQSPVQVPRHALDIKAGQLQLLIRPWTQDEVPHQERLANSRPFVPMMRRCFDIGPSLPAEWKPGEPEDAYPGMISLRQGQSIHTNANLSYSTGFTFDPGTYEVTPYLSFPPGAGDGGLDQVVMGRPLRITVRRPQNRQAELDGEILHRPDVGASLALGGSTCLQKAADELEVLRARRERDNPRGAADPIVAALTRSAGLYEGRQDNTDRAAELLSLATRPGARDAFDPHTAEHTRRLADRYRVQQTTPMPITVVVDMWTRPKAGGEPVSTRGSGFLLVHEPVPVTPGSTPVKGTGWGVIAPAGQLPLTATNSADHEVSAEVIVSSGDGLTERIDVTRIDLVFSDAGDPAGAVLALARPVPADRRLPLDVPRTPVAKKSVDPENFFDRPGTPTASIAALHGDELADLASAADIAMEDAPRAAEPVAGVAMAADPVLVEQAAVLHTYIGRAGTDTWNCWCDATPICQPVPPPTDIYEPRGKSADPTEPGAKGPRAKSS